MQPSLTASPRPAPSGKPQVGKTRKGKGKGKVSEEDVTEGMLVVLEIIFGDDISQYLSDGASNSSGALIKGSKALVFGDVRTALRWNGMSPRARALWLLREVRLAAA